MSSKGDSDQLIEKVRRNTMLSVTTTTVTAPPPPNNKPTQQNIISAAGDRNLDVSLSQSKHVQERNKNVPPYTNFNHVKGNQPNIRNTAAETSTNAGFKKLALPISSDSGVLPKSNISLRAVPSGKTEKMNQPQKNSTDKPFPGFRTPNDGFISDSLDLPEPMKKIASSFGKNIQSKELTVTVQKPSQVTSNPSKDTKTVTVFPSHMQVGKMTASADFFKNVGNSVTAQPVNEIKKTSPRILCTSSVPGASKIIPTPMNIEVTKTTPTKPSSVAEVSTTVPATKKQATSTPPFSDTARNPSETSPKTSAKPTVTSSRPPNFVLANSSPSVPALSLISNETVPTNVKDNSFSYTVLTSLKEKAVLDTINAGNGWSCTPSVTITKPIIITPSSTLNPKGRADATAEATQKTNSSGSSSTSGNVCKRDDLTDKSGGSPSSGTDLPRETNVLSSAAEVDTFETSSYFISSEEMDTSEGMETPDKNQPEEPECLTISSDEESDEDEQFIDLPDKPEISFSVSNKEPPFIEKNEKSSVAADGSMCEPDEESALDSTSGDGYVSLNCRTVRIGSLKLSPPVPVVLSKFGLRIVIPNSENAVLKIPFREITRVLIHFGRSFPVIFYHVTSNMGVRARSILKMAYFDPNTSSEAQRRITLFPEHMTDTNRLHICEIFKDTTLLRDLSQEEANQILVSSAPKEVQRVVKQVPDPVQTIMVFPPPPAKGGISINTEDYSCLARDVFLNDVIIDFYLKYLYLNHMTAEDREKTHIFSSFFYKRLTDKATPMPRHLKSAEKVVSAAEIRHSRVTKWTKNIDIFSKDYIVIPLNENQHWFLAIICFPGLRGPVRFLDNKPLDAEPKIKVENASKDSSMTADSEKPGSSAGALTITTVKVESKDRLKVFLDDDNDAEDRDEADATDEDPNVSEEDTDEEYLRGAVGDVPKPRTRSTREPIKQPCILIFDSLAGASRARIIATLRDYLRIEYKTKHGEDRDFSKNVVKGSVPAVPQQDNFTDCGLFVLQYVESFFDNKITDYHIPIKTLRNWFQPENVCNKRYEIQQLLHDLMRVQEIDIENLRLPNLHLGGSDDEEDDDDDDEYYEEPSGSDEEYQDHYETVVFHPGRCGYPAEEGETFEEDDDEELVSRSRYDLYDSDEDEMGEHMDSDEDSSDVVYKNMDEMKELQYHQMHEAGDHRCRSEDGDEEEEIEEEEIEADIDDEEEEHQQFSSDIEEKINNSSLNREAVSITVNNRSFSSASSSQTAIVTSTTSSAKPKQRGADKFKACSPWKSLSQPNDECSSTKKFRQN